MTDTNKTSTQEKLKKLVLELQRKTKELSSSIQSATRKQTQSEDTNKIDIIKKQIGS